MILEPDGENPVIYFISDGEKLVKIGYTTGLPESRLKQLQTGNGKKLRLLTAIRGDRATELIMHTAFNDLRESGEWFRNEGVLARFCSLLESYERGSTTFAPVIMMESEDDLLALELFCRLARRGL